MLPSGVYHCATLGHPGGFGDARGSADHRLLHTQVPMPHSVLGSVGRIWFVDSCTAFVYGIEVKKIGMLNPVATGFVQGSQEGCLCERSERSRAHSCRRNRRASQCCPGRTGRSGAAGPGGFREEHPQAVVHSEVVETQFPAVSAERPGYNILISDFFYTGVPHRCNHATYLILLLKSFIDPLMNGLYAKSPYLLPYQSDLLASTPIAPVSCQSNPVFDLVPHLKSAYSPPFSSLQEMRSARGSRVPG